MAGDGTEYGGDYYTGPRNYVWNGSKWVPPAAQASQGTLADLIAVLNALDGRVVNTTVNQTVDASARRELTEAEIDAIHAGLLKKKRSGSLGLGD